MQSWPCQSVTMKTLKTALTENLSKWYRNIHWQEQQKFSEVFNFHLWWWLWFYVQVYPRGASLRFLKWNYFSQKVHRFPDRGREVAITQLKRQHVKVHFTIKCCVVMRVFINHTHKVGKKMFPFKLLEVYYIKNKKSGKRSENIMIQKLNNSALGTRSRDAAAWEP